MIWTAFIAMQIAAAAPPLVLSDGHRSVRVATVATSHGPMFRADALAAMMPIDVRHDSASSYTISGRPLIARLKKMRQTPEY